MVTAQEPFHRLLDVFKIIPVMDFMCSSIVFIHEKLDFSSYNKQEIPGICVAVNHCLRAQANLQAKG